jgi:hypothetical protein
VAVGGGEGVAVGAGVGLGVMVGSGVCVAVGLGGGVTGSTAPQAFRMSRLTMRNERKALLRTSEGSLLEKKPI